MECVGTIVSASKQGVVTNGLVHRRSSNIKKIDALLIKNQKADRSTNLCHCKSRFYSVSFFM